MKFDVQVVSYLALLGILLAIVMFIKFRNGILFKVLLKIAASTAVILLFNYLVKLLKFNFMLPLNPLSVLTAAFLELPGFLLLLIIKFLIYP